MRVGGWVRGGGVEGLSEEGNDGVCGNYSPPWPGAHENRNQQIDTDTLTPSKIATKIR